MSGIPLGYVPYLPPGALLFTAVVWRHLLNGATQLLGSIQEIYGHVGGRKRNLFGERVKFASMAVFGGSVLPEEILIRHTHFGIYSRALTKHAADSWSRDIIDAHQWNGHIPSPLQRSGTFPKFQLATTSLRSCSACVAQDMDELGFASWRILHTLPPVHHCPHHGNALISEVESSIGNNLWTMRLPTGIPINQLNHRFESASDGYVAYLHLWIDLLEGSLPIVAADAWADYMNIVVESIGSVEDAIATLSAQVSASWGTSPDRLPDILGAHVQRDFLRLELEHRSAPSRIAQKLVILGTCDLLGLASPKDTTPAQLVIPLRNGAQSDLRGSREELLRNALLHVGFPLAIAPGLASGLSASSAAKTTGVHRHVIQRAIHGFSDSTLETLSSHGTWPDDSWLTKELAKRRD